MNPEDYIINIFKQNNGFARVSDIENAGINKYHLQKLKTKNIIVKVKNGLYKLSDISETNIYTEINKIIPSGVLCLFSTWYYYELTTYIPHEQHIAVSKNSKFKLPDYPIIKLWYWTKKPLEIGVIDGDIKIYDLEKSICDAIRYRNKIGTDLLNEILKSYLNRKDKNLDKLMKYAKQLRIEKSIKQYIEILL